MYTKEIFVLIQHDSQVGEHTISMFLSRQGGSSKERLKKSGCLHQDVHRACPVHSASGWGIERGPESHTGKSEVFHTFSAHRAAKQELGAFLSG